MEAVPKLPMISFELKVSPDRQPTDFGKLKLVCIGKQRYYRFMYVLEEK